MTFNGLKNLYKGIPGISDTLLNKFKNDKNLNQAIKFALPIIKRHTSKNINYQSKILNFYDKNTIAPYNTIAAKGPWIISDEGSIIYDVGGYGMLGFGHSPSWVGNILAKRHVMANIMTPNIMQYKLTNELTEKIGINKDCPYSHFAFLNSGSESMELATRISNIKTSNNNKSFFIVLKDSFHGRTYSAATLSDSCSHKYNELLNDFNNENIKKVKINDINEFESTFKNLKKDGKIKAVIMEPVMGEGNPGIQLNLDFYNKVRKLTQENNTDLIIDSVQSAIRTNGYLSIIDYPELKSIESPDMEIFSKAINSGQIPLSVLAMKENIANKFKPGLYGNTMCGNPKTLEIAYETLKRVNNGVTKNIQDKGIIFKNMLLNLKNKYPEFVTHVTGKGLLLALHINKKYKVDDYEGLEYMCRYNGLNVIHGGENALRFTPYFLISIKEIELIYEILNKSIKEYIKKM